MWKEGRSESPFAFGYLRFAAVPLRSGCHLGGHRPMNSTSERRFFASAHDLKRPLRAMLSDLQTIEEVRIIEEAGP